jgi:polyisoprenoid-binding protein YceI
MSKWFFEPGHTAAEFCARHMMVTYVRGHFKDVHGTLEFDPADPLSASLEAVIDARNLHTGEPARDAHLRSADFLDVDRFPEIRYRGTVAGRIGAQDYLVAGELTIRGVSKPVQLEVHFLGSWETPWWEEGRDQGPKTRAGFVATTTIDRHDFGVSWNSALDNGGVVVGDLIRITLDVEAIAACHGFPRRLFPVADPGVAG